MEDLNSSVKESAQGASVKNTLFPVFLKLEDLRLLIIGGGNVALEKLNAVYRNSPKTQVTVVSRTINPAIRQLAEIHSNLELEERSVQSSDFDDCDLVFIAINDFASVNEFVLEAHNRNLLVNVADTPGYCDFYLSSVVTKGDLKIAISSNGKSPTFTKRLKEILNEYIPDESQTSLENLNELRDHLKGDFSEKVKKLNEVTSILNSNKNLISLQPHLAGGVLQRKKRSWIHWLAYSAAAVGLMITGHLLFSLIPSGTIGGMASTLYDSIDSTLFIFIAAGFIAQMVDGSLGMAYGVTASTFLMSFGIPPAATSASVHASEIFTTGASGLSHLKFKNVNAKLFKHLLLPGILGAGVGAYILSSLEEYAIYIKPFVAVYTLILGVIILVKAVKKLKDKRKVKRIGILAFFGAFLDSIGGGGWGPIVSSTLIAQGRNVKYTVGSVNLAEFFITLTSSVTFIIFLGLEHWQIISGLIIGGVIAAPIAAYITSKIPVKAGLIFVGIVIVIVSLKNILSAVL
ncbi:MAG: hypothetical protein RL007_139 [Bacteroidota bacterium]|jgi:siroheme synthase-like protein